MAFCDPCGVTPDFIEAILGTSTDTQLQSGGLAFVIVAKCDLDVSVLGTSLTAWNAALQNPDNYRAFRNCEMSGGTAMNSAALATIGSCNVPVLPNTKLDVVSTFVFRHENSAADVYKFWLSLHGKRVQMAYGSCDDSRIYQWRKALVVLSEVTIPDTDTDLIQYTVTFNYKADSTSMDTLNQTWAISDLVIP